MKTLFFVHILYLVIGKVKIVAFIKRNFGVQVKGIRIYFRRCLKCRLYVRFFLVLCFLHFFGIFGRIPSGYPLSVFGGRNGYLVTLFGKPAHIFIKAVFRKTAH